MRPRAAFWDGFALTVGAVFSVAGVALAFRGERFGVAAAAFFGSCTAVAVWSIARRRRIRAHAGAVSVDVAPGMPLRASRFALVPWALGLLVVGTAMGLTAERVPALAWLGWGMTALGLGLLALVVFGPRMPYLQFEAAGLRFGTRHYEFLLEWDNVARVVPGDLHGQDLLAIAVGSVERLVATTEPGGAGERVAKMVRSNRAWFGADLVVICSQYGADVALLARAIAKRIPGPGGACPEEPAGQLPPG